MAFNLGAAYSLQYLVYCDCEKVSESAVLEELVRSSPLEVSCGVICEGMNQT